MSNKDYTKYAKSNDAVEPAYEVAPEPIPVIVEQPVVEVTPEPVIEPEVISEPEPVVARTHKIGRVVDCVRLNVRKAPKFDADVVCEIPCNTEVEIYEDESEGDFYKIYTASGIEGFCMKSYILEK